LAITTHESADVGVCLMNHYEGEFCSTQRRGWSGQGLTDSWTGRTVEGSRFGYRDRSRRSRLQVSPSTPSLEMVEMVEMV
jgi:hypothetical protein